MRSALRNRSKSLSLNTVAPQPDTAEYLPEVARLAREIIYRSPALSSSGNIIYIANAAALPDEFEVDYDTLLPYVLARLPSEEDLVKGQQYEVVFFSDSSNDGVTGSGEGGKKQAKPGLAWFLSAYQTLSRAMRKRIQRLYIVHERTWVKMLMKVLGSVVSPKFRRKVVHASTISALSQYINVQDLLIPPSAYVQDRKLSPHVITSASGPRAFGAKYPLPWNVDGGTRLPRVLRETTSFLLLADNLQTEGLFRVPPNVRTKEILREAYDRGQQYIVWKEGDATLPFPAHLTTDVLSQVLEELEPANTYGIHLAAGLCKFWYAELQTPLIPVDSYQKLRSSLENTDIPLEITRLVEILDPKSEWSCLPTLSREIMTRHLVPMLAVIASHSDTNKMTAMNLATCFAPTLLRGMDPIEDARMTASVCRLVATGIINWDTGLREALGINDSAFIDDIAPPNRTEEYEDPLIIEDIHDKASVSPMESMNEQMSGIVLRDNEYDHESTMNIETDMPPPPLPPRKMTGSSVSGESPVSQSTEWGPPSRTNSDLTTSTVPSSMPGVEAIASTNIAASLKRKPAPVLATGLTPISPHKRTTSISESPVTISPSTTFSSEPHPVSGTLPLSSVMDSPYEAMNIPVKRKPVNSSSLGSPNLG